nr:MAG: hypothetical protein E4H34_04470 [Hyphomicrobiales bacterium]
MHGIAITALIAGICATVLTGAANSQESPSLEAASIPDFAGIWMHPFVGFDPPLEGPGPVVNVERLPDGRANDLLRIGDHTSPILKPNAADIVRQLGDILRAGLVFPDPDNQCLLQPLPYIFWNFEMRMLQEPDFVTFLYAHDLDYRRVRINGSHPETIVPTFHGDSVGHYEGDTLVIDTVGIKTGPYRMIDRFGTPYTEALHVVERYRPIDYDEAIEAHERARQEWRYVANNAPDPDYRGPGVQLEFLVEDQGAFTTPWSATITYLQARHSDWQERVCAENIDHYYDLERFYSDPDAYVPSDDTPDF